MSAWTAPEYAARIPADVDRPDRILAGLTARQLAILTSVALLVAGLVTISRRLLPSLPLPIALALGLPIALAGVVLALGYQDGLSMDRLAWAALRYARAPRRLVPATQTPTSQPSVALTLHTRHPEPPPAALRLPLRDLTADGVLELGAAGVALICRASPVNFGLRTPEEQAQLVTGFARFLHGAVTSDPVQILLRATPIDLDPVIAQLDYDAGGLPHPALETAARDHADFLAWLAARRDVLARELLVVFREPGQHAHTAVQHRAEHAAGLLAAVGIALIPLERDEAARVLRASMNPGLAPAAPAALPAGQDPPATDEDAELAVAYAGPRLSGLGGGAR